MSIKEYKELTGVSYYKLAKLIPCKPQYISMIASGKRRPSYEIAVKIQQVTDGKVAITNWYK